MQNDEETEVTELNRNYKDPALYTAQSARLVVECVECGKPRLIYSILKPSARQLNRLEGWIEDEAFTCGQDLFPELHPQHKVMVVREGLNCASPVEVAFYSSKVSKPIG